MTFSAGDLGSLDPDLIIAPSRVTMSRISFPFGSLPPDTDKVSAVIGSSRACQSLTERKRKALLITDTDDRLMAAAAKIGEIKIPKNGKSTPAAIGTPVAL